MFRKNLKHVQNNLFGINNSISQKLHNELLETEEHKFYELIFCNIKEEDFECLYSDIDSRPNAPVNVLIGSILLKHRYNLTYEQLFKNIKFNLLYKTALGLNTLDEVPYSEATMYNFLLNLNNHFIKTGENLLEIVFDHLTEKQLKELKLKTNIQRTDSFLAASNIRQYTRLQLLVEILIRLYRILSSQDKEKHKRIFEKYINKTSSQFAYKLTTQDIEYELIQIGEIYHQIHKILRSSYEDIEIFRIFERVYNEQFCVVNDKITIKTSDQISSSTLQSPDDIDATYRNKNGKPSRGQSINIVETANPENPINLITDISVNPNNIDDSKVLNQRLDIIKSKTPEIDELHFDGAYTSKENDEKCNRAEFKITQVQTGIRGPNPKFVQLGITKTDDNAFEVFCPQQTVEASKSFKRYKASFDLAICENCQIAGQCNLIRNKRAKVYYFTEEEYLKKARFKSLGLIPPNRRTLRANVEATVSEFSRKLQNKKLKIRGRYKTAVFACATAISVNFGRIYRYLSKIKEEQTVKICYCAAPT